MLSHTSRLEAAPDRRIFCASATGADYALLSPSFRRFGYGAPQRRASVLGDQAERAALNERSGPLFTIHDIPPRGTRKGHRCQKGVGDLPGGFCLVSPDLA